MTLEAYRLQDGDQIIDSRGRMYEVTETRAVEGRRIGIHLREIDNPLNEGEIVCMWNQPVLLLSKDEVRK